MSSTTTGAERLSDVEAVERHRPLRPNPHHERRWLALGVILIAQMMLLLDATIVNVALPSMQADLGFSDDARGWVVTAYLLAFGSLLLLGGRLADAFGRKTCSSSGWWGSRSPPLWAARPRTSRR